MKRLLAIAVMFTSALLSLEAMAEFRFPMPTFESGYHHPAMHTPPPVRFHPALDVTMLAVMLGMTAWIVLRRRSRREVFLMTVLACLYFGFYRKGCVCAVGSLQNVLGIWLVPGGGSIPLVVAAFFFLPLVTALYTGRIFCAAVCPLGAVQEIAAVHPVEVPKPLDAILSLLPYAYLGLTVVSLSMGTGYLICQYDPFVGFFRHGASFGMLATGGVFLIVGLFVARPYCRYLCPYGVLLGWASRLSRWHAAITPAECIQCRLCESSCPYGAIVLPVPGEPAEKRREGARRLGRLLLLSPAIILAGAVTGALAHGAMAHMHPAVRLSERVAQEERGAVTGHTVESETFRAGKQTPAELYAEALAIKHQYLRASTLFGAFMGLVICGRLLRLSAIRTKDDYTVDRGACLSCARCFDYCPVKRQDVAKPHLENTQDHG